MQRFRETLMAKILLVEDDSEISESIVNWLELEKFTIDLAASGEDALEMLAKSSYDLLLLDWGLPGINGLEVFKRYRAAGGQSPVIFVTGRYDLEHMSFGADGPDDFITKPFDMRELSCRIRLRLRQPGTTRLAKLSVGNVLLDQETRKVYIDTKAVRLTNNEYAVLELLMAHPNQTFSCQAVLDAVWADDPESSAETVQACVKNLTRKLSLEGQPCLLKTTEGQGFAVAVSS
jgi:DNA-binding response OmpR family regulator